MLNGFLLWQARILEPLAGRAGSCLSIPDSRNVWNVWFHLAKYTTGTLWHIIRWKQRSCFFESKSLEKFRFCFRYFWAIIYSPIRNVKHSYSSLWVWSSLARLHQNAHCADFTSGWISLLHFCWDHRTENEKRNSKILRLPINENV